MRKVDMAPPRQQRARLVCADSRHRRDCNRFIPFPTRRIGNLSRIVVCHAGGSPLHRGVRRLAKASSPSAMSGERNTASLASVGDLPSVGVGVGVESLDGLQTQTHGGGGGLADLRCHHQCLVECLTRGSDCIDDAEVLCPFGIECAAGDQEFTGDVDRKRARSPKRVRRTSQPDRVWFREGRIALWQRRRSDRRPVRFRNRHQARSPRLQRSGACSAGAE